MKRNRHIRISAVLPKEEPSAFSVVAKELAGKVPDSIKHSTFDGGSNREFRESLVIRAQPIAVGIPFDELAYSQFMVNLLGLHLMPWDMPITTTSTYLPMARNQIHDAFIKNKDQGNYLLMLDSDVLPPPNLISTLLKHNLPMVGGWYRKKEKYPIKHLDGTTEITQRPVVYDYIAEKNGYVQRISPGQGLEKVSGAGAGAWLMRRDVAEALGKSPYGQDVGEDLVICEKIEKLGFDMYIDWSMKCGHIGTFFV